MQDQDAERDMSELMRQLFFAFIAVLSPVLLLDRFIQSRKPTDCAEEDVPVVPTPPTTTWWLDKDGKIHSTKMNWKK